MSHPIPLDTSDPVSIAAAASSTLRPRVGPHRSRRKGRASVGEGAASIKHVVNLPAEAGTGGYYQDQQILPW
jgi:hypothetical protein